MEIYNIIDERDRFLGFKAYLSDESGQYDSHTISYLRSRELRQEMGQIMGLEKKLTEVND